MDEGTLYPGLAVGLGVERKFTESFSGRVQAVFTKYWEFDDPIQALAIEQDYNLDTAAIQFGFTWRFGQ